MSCAAPARHLCISSLPRVELLPLGATLVVDRAVEAVDGSVILASVGGEFVIRRLKLVPVRCLEYLDGSENVTMIDEGDDITDDAGAVEVFGVVTYALNDMRTSEFDDLAA